MTRRFFIWLSNRIETKRVCTDIQVRGVALAVTFFLNYSSDQISVVQTWSGVFCVVCESLPSKYTESKKSIAQHLHSHLNRACEQTQMKISELSLLPLSLFLQVVLSCMLARLAVPARALAALQVDTRPSRPPPTHSLHPQRVSPFRRLGPWGREGNKGEELLPRKWYSSFLK